MDKPQKECNICFDVKDVYATCPGCDCIFCEEDYNELNTPYIAEPALLNREDGLYTDQAWAQMQRDEIEYNKKLKPKTRRQHLLDKYKGSELSGGNDVIDKKALISQGLDAMGIEFNKATEQQKLQALQMIDVGVICPCCNVRILKVDNDDDEEAIALSLQNDGRYIPQGARGQEVQEQEHAYNTSHIGRLVNDYKQQQQRMGHMEQLTGSASDIANELRIMFPNHQLTPQQFQEINREVERYLPYIRELRPQQPQAMRFHIAERGQGAAAVHVPLPDDDEKRYNESIYNESIFDFLTIGIQPNIIASQVLWQSNPFP